jgi:hypothetical protein
MEQLKMIMVKTVSSVMTRDVNFGSDSEQEIVVAENLGNRANSIVI